MQANSLPDASSAPRRETWASPATKASVAAAGASGLPDADALRAAVAHFTALIDRDVKDPALKDLQGRIWERGYASGEIVGEARWKLRPHSHPPLTAWASRAESRGHDLCR